MGWHHLVSFHVNLSTHFRDVLLMKLTSQGWQWVILLIVQGHGKLCEGDCFSHQNSKGVFTSQTVQVGEAAPILPFMVWRKPGMCMVMLGLRRLHPALCQPRSFTLCKMRIALCLPYELRQKVTGLCQAVRTRQGKASLFQTEAV